VVVEVRVELMEIKLVEKVEWRSELSHHLP
jgi:hypothetical protein